MQTGHQEHGSSHTSIAPRGSLQEEKVASAQASTTLRRPRQLCTHRNHRPQAPGRGCLAELSAPAQGSWCWRRSCLIMGERAPLSCFSGCEGSRRNKVVPVGHPKPDNIDRKRRLLARPQIWGGGGAISARYLTECTRSLKPHGSILSRTRVGGSMDQGYGPGR